LPLPEEVSYFHIIEKNIINKEGERRDEFKAFYGLSERNWGLVNY